MIKYHCSNGERVSQATIDKRRKEAYEKMAQEHSIAICGAYPDRLAKDHDHTISQARCKQLRKAELIWDTDNIEFSSREAHESWESYKSGIFEEHANVIRRMLFMKKHDPERFEKRMQCLSDYKLIKTLRDG